MHFILCILTYASFASKQICIFHLIICTIDSAYNYYHFITWNFVFHFIHIILGISLCASQSMHLIICISSYNLINLCIPFYVLNCIHVFISILLCFVHFTIVETRCTPTDGPTDGQTDIVM